MKKYIFNLAMLVAMTSYAQEEKKIQYKSVNLKV